MRLLLLLVALAGCNREDLGCYTVGNGGSFSIVLTNDTWMREDYRIIVSYESFGQQFAHICDVSVPAFAWDGALDGGPPPVSDGGGALGFGVEVPCRTVQGSEFGASLARVAVGRALEAIFPGTPLRAKLEVDTPRGRVLERELELPARGSYEEPRKCDGRDDDSVFIELP
ncbi:MAG: hypothetical protein ABW352_10550 [Polyangiales bacterium]